MKPKLLPLGLLLLLATATPVRAAEDAADGGLLSPSGGLTFWTIVTFLVVLALLMKFAYPHILGAVEAREQRLLELQEAAERDREEAAELLAQQQREFEELRARAQEVIAEARAGAERMRETMLAEARSEQEAMLARSEREVQAQLERALATVRAETVDLAIAAAERLLQRNLDDAANRRIVQQFLGEIESRDAAVAAGV